MTLHSKTQKIQGELNMAAENNLDVLDAENQEIISKVELPYARQKV